MKVTDTNSCAAADTIVLTKLSTPVLQLGADTTVCPGDTLLLDAGSGYTSYLWGTADTTQAIEVISSGIYTLQVEGMGGCFGYDTIEVNYFAVSKPIIGNDTIACIYDTLLISAQSGYLAYNWNTGQSTQSISVDSSGEFIVVVTDSNSCHAKDTMVVTFSNTCVWPGDANSDGVANNFDLLAIGTQYSKTGPQRQNASMNWQAQPAYDWNDTLTNGANIKHADCDGNGAVNATDTTALSLNYSRTHNKKGQLQMGGSDDPLLALYL